MKIHFVNAARNVCVVMFAYSVAKGVYWCSLEGYFRRRNLVVMRYWFSRVRWQFIWVFGLEIGRNFVFLKYLNRVYI